MRGENALPSWVFDIEDDEDLELASAYPNRSVSLLEELEIDLAQITYSVVWMLKCPFFILRKFVDIPASLPFATSRYACLRSMAIVWGKVADYNNHPIKLGKRRQSTIGVSSARVETCTEDGRASSEAGCEAELLSDAGYGGGGILTMPLSELGDNSRTNTGLGARSRSRTNSESVGMIGSAGDHASSPSAAKSLRKDDTSLPQVSILGKFFSTNGNMDRKRHSDDDLLERDNDEGEEGGEGSSPRENDALLSRHNLDSSRRAKQGHSALEGSIRRSLSAQSSTQLHHEDSSDKPYDFWGPCGVVTGYCAMLWLAGQEDVSYVYLVWVLSATFHHFTVRPFLEESSVLFHLSVLGYSLVPLIPLVFLIIICRMPSWACSLIESVAVTWGSLAAIMSYNTILRPLLNSEKLKNRLALLVPAVVIFQLYAIAFMPTRRWQINNGEALKIL